MKEYQDNKIRKKNKAFFILFFFRYQFRYFFRYQIFPIPIPVLFSGTKFFRYRFRDFFRYQIFPIPVPRLFSGTNIFRYRYRYHQKNEKFPVPGIPGTGTSHSVIQLTKCVLDMFKILKSIYRLFCLLPFLC